MKPVSCWISVLVPGDGDPRHGYNGYSNLGCRCEACRAANTAWNLARREKRAKLLAADPSIQPHGVESTYFNYKCRCDECKAEHARRASLRERSHRNAVTVASALADTG